MIAAGELLIEFLSEEIPARMQQEAARELKERMRSKLQGQGLSFSEIKTFVTPRRLVLQASDVPLRQQDRKEERRGPRIDASAQAIQGFLQSVGLKSLEECEQRSTAKGIFWFALQNIVGRETEQILPLLIDEIITEFTWPKVMHWGANTRTWVRPLHSILCLHAGKKINGRVSLGEEEVVFTSLTPGHRFMAPTPFAVSHFEDYKTKLSQAYVVVDQEERAQRIERACQDLASQHGLTLKVDEALLEEVTGLVEWPKPFLGTIEANFMTLPPEVLITSMRVHQKYFATENTAGELAPYFIVMANGEAQDQGRTIIAGNEKVLRARLSDAAFFYEQDRKKTLKEHGQGLEKAVFHGNLGSMAEKSQRLAKLSEFIADVVHIFPHQAHRAGLLLKADLMSSLVGEFPELQGIMGYYYALNDGEDSEVACAIRDHYCPKGPKDRLPDSEVGKIVALADKMDTLVGFFAVGIKPTGSKDPFALRRAALGCIRLLENFLDLTLDQLIEKAYTLYQPIFAKEALSFQETLQELKSFFLDRLIVYWKEQSLRQDYMRAVFAVEKEISIALLFKRIQALEAFMTHTSNFGSDLLAVYRRCCNIVALEEKKDGVSYKGSIQPSLLIDPFEQKLYKALKDSLEAVQSDLKKHDFMQAMKRIAELKPVIDDFFQHVTVNVDKKDIRSNRLKLLSLIRSTLQEVADFSKIEE